MQLIVSPGAIPVNKIALQTRIRRDIDNCQPAELSAFMLSQVAQIEQFYPNITKRSNPCATYNCHGFTFASRRTCVEEPDDIPVILRDDKFQEVSDADVLPGDIIIYYDSDNVVQHSGLVVSRPKEPFGFPEVCSKWGGFGEAIHDAPYGPYNTGNWKFFRIP